MPTAFEQLRENRYLVEYRMFSNYSEFDLTHRGTYHHGSREADKELQKQKMRCYKAIFRSPLETSPQIFDIWNSGDAPVFIHASKDLPGIHALIQRHMQDFVEYTEELKNSMVKVDQHQLLKQISFIRELDKFAKAIFEANRIEFPNSTIPIISYFNTFSNGFNLPNNDVQMSVDVNEEYTPITNRLDISKLVRR